jgi:uncharacterized protein (TIGR00296 family)
MGNAGYPRLLCYYSSQQAKNIFEDNFNPNEKIVTYASIVYTTEPYRSRQVIDGNETFMTRILTPYDKIISLKYARSCLNHAIKGTEIEEIIYSPSLQQKAGLFVTYKNKNILRGCIGYLEQHFTIKRNTKEYAIQSAINDSRFEQNPITEEELTEIDISINILDKLKNISFDEYLSNSKYLTGRDGVYLISSSNAYYLPSVYDEHKYSWKKIYSSKIDQCTNDQCYEKIGQLISLCHKTNLSWNCYQNATLQYNEGLEFDEKEYSKYLKKQ